MQISKTLNFQQQCVPFVQVFRNPGIIPGQQLQRVTNSIKRNSEAGVTVKTVPTEVEPQEPEIQGEDLPSSAVAEVPEQPEKEIIDQSRYKYVKEKPTGLAEIFGGRGLKGERSLWDLREEVKGTMKISVQPSKRKTNGTMKLKRIKVKGGKVVSAKVVGAGRDAIYVGFDKDDMDKKARGEMGSYILDDNKKYPDKENVGVLLGATGGFQGGEVGLNEFVKTGQVLTPEQRRLLKQSNPIPTIAFFLGLASSGYYFYSTHPEIGEKLSNKVVQYQSQFSDTQIFLIKSGLIFTGGLLGVLLIESALTNLSRAVVSGLQKLIVFVAFWGGIFLLGRYLLMH
eukprot:TRINITY_DN3210_c0_g1_i1.p1 TRINITY_DN3210_c0_g1~~TRINITY_DN3210_c0_g1_i1.p1  ORF type:complete len:341 (-),score=46.84 TRINITY_DN3210_c0_g1_i1:402-1424(-)